MTDFLTDLTPPLACWASNWTRVSQLEEGDCPTETSEHSTATRWSNQYEDYHVIKNCREKLTLQR